MATLLATRAGAGPDPAPVASCGAVATAPSRAQDVVVGSANFPESELLGEIYADALQAKGIPVTRDFGFGSREVYYPLVCTGQITVMPEYNGALLTTSVAPGSTAIGTGQVDAALRADLPPSLMILNPAQAQDSDSVTVTQATVAKYHLTSIASLRGVAADLVIGGPQEFLGREEGLDGLSLKYGLTFKRFQFLDDSGAGSIQALVSGRVQAADIFTSDPLIQADHLVRLADPRNVFTAENVVPLVYKPDASATVITTLNAVSAKLTTAALSGLDTQVIVRDDNITAVAEEWLRQVGLVSALPAGQNRCFLRTGASGPGTRRTGRT
jgi:osmoprotectant transport system substrate-binding protein